MAEEQDQLTPDMQRALEQARAPQDDALDLHSRRAMRTIILPPIVQQMLPRGTELTGELLDVPERDGGHSSGPGLRLSIPVGPTRAEPVFRR